MFLPSHSRYTFDSGRWRKCLNASQEKCARNNRQAASERERVTESICGCYSFDQTLNVNASWTRDTGQVCIHIHIHTLRAFLFPVLIMIIVQRFKEKVSIIRMRKPKRLYLLTHSAASVWIEYQSRGSVRTQFSTTTATREWRRNERISWEWFN